MARVAGVATDRPPVGERGRRRALPSGRERFVFDVRGLGLASVVLYPARRFRCRFAPAGLALRRHGREESRSAETHLHTLPACFGSLARGLVKGPHVPRLGGYDGEVIPGQGLTSAATRRRASACVSPPLLHGR